MAVVRRRLDVELVRRGLADSRTAAARLIGDGRVARRRDARHHLGPAGRAGDPIRIARHRAPIRVPWGDQARRCPRRLRAVGRRAAGARRRRVHRRVHRLPAAARRRARRTRSTSAGVSSRGAAPGPAGDGARAHERPRRSTPSDLGGRGRPRGRRPLVHLARGRWRPRSLACATADGRPRAAREAAVRGRAGRGSGAAASSATRRCTRRCSPRSPTGLAAAGLVVVDVVASPLRGRRRQRRVLRPRRPARCRRSTPARARGGRARARVVSEPRDCDVGLAPAPGPRARARPRATTPRHWLREHGRHGARRQARRRPHRTRPTSASTPRRSPTASTS